MSGNLQKPRGLGTEYGAQFRDQSVADAYPNRPPYPAEVYDSLSGLIQDEPPTVLDLGCGTGDISRGLASRVKQIDAVDPSEAMLRRGQSLPGGRQRNIRWIVSTAEDFAYPVPYALVVTAESLHWMDWYVVLPRIRRSLTSRGRLAIVLGREFRPVPWQAELGGLINRYSTNRDYQPYNLLTELSTRNLFAAEGMLRTQPVPFSQSIDDYVESFHSRNGLSRNRMGSGAMLFDAELRTIIGRHQPGPILEFELVADLAWGLPTAL